MLYNPEKTLLKMEKNSKKEEYCDLVYDLESFIIDNCYPKDSENCVSKQEHNGKMQLHKKLTDEKQLEFVISKLRPILTSLEIPESLKGFRMLEFLVYECAKSALLKNGYSMTEIYPVVAEQFGITAHNCERLCRYACSFAKPSHSFIYKYPCLESLSHRTVEKVTVKELADLLVWYLINRCGYKIDQ